MSPSEQTGNPARRRRAAVAAAGLASLSIGVASHADAFVDSRSDARHIWHSSQPPDEQPRSLTAAQRDVIREATDRFRDVDTAIAAGYVPTDVCAGNPEMGGAMGYHYVNRGLAGDAVIDPTLPEILLYAPVGADALELVAIEYFMVDADGDLSTDDDRPTLLGNPFDGPMEGHEPGMPVHYDIHAWVWKHNPAGELTPWNPDVQCPVAAPTTSADDG